MSDPGILVTPDDVKERMPVILDYTSRDFASIRALLVGMAQGLMPEWETVGESTDFGTLLLELFAYMGDVMHFYIDRTASEAFLGTAVRRQSVLYIADQMGYVPIGQQAATVRLLLSITEDAPESITLPKGTRVHTNPDNSDDMIVFETDSPVTLDPGDPDNNIPPDTDIEVYATEGITVNDTWLGVSQGQPGTDFIISNKGVIYGSITMRSMEGGKDVIWTYTSDLSLSRPTQAMFTTFVDDQGWTHIVMGDNAAGRIPPVNAELFVTYRYGVGARANDVAVNEITTVVPPTDTDVWTVSVSNPDSPIGGTDPETVESMRYSIPRASGRIKSRAVTLNDFADLAMQVPNVAKAIAHGAIYTAVYVRVAPVDGNGNNVYMQKLCAAVEAYLADKSMVGATVYAEPRVFFDLWRNVFIQMTVHVTEGYNRTGVRLSVESAVRAVLDFDAVDFGTDITIGTIYRAALSVPGVDWVELTYLNDKAPPPMTDMEPVTVVMTGEYDHSNVTDTTTDPGKGNIRTSSTPTTSLAVSNITDANIDVSFGLVDVRVGDEILLRQGDDATKWQSHVVTAAVVNNTTWVSIPVSILNTGPGGMPDRGNKTLLMTVVRLAVQEENRVVNLMSSETDGTNLMIPRIDPTDPLTVELETSYPNLNESERTHDGLWVVAVGGLVNT